MGPVCWSVDPLICACQTIIEREADQGVVLQLHLCQADRIPGRMFTVCSLNNLSDVLLFKQQNYFISFCKINF